MALNNFMHSRNIYKVPPDFSKLYATYPEFAKIAKIDLNGKVSINFQDSNSLRVLTTCLLHADFNLIVNIPEDRLVPTLPLRLNYILWIEDIMTAIERKENIRGLDIGTGACAIYPLLAASKKWQMTGTETDQISIKTAQKIIDDNNLQAFITISRNSTTTILDYLFQEQEDLLFDFCMCNPPFYSSVEELCESRSTARAAPKNGFTGSIQELVTEGGELEFIRKLIVESKAYKDRILIFTTMVGHKYNLKILLEDFNNEGISNTHTEFCQGRTTRWGLAWTYQCLDINNLVPPRDKSRKKSVPLTYVIPRVPNISYNLNCVFQKIKSILDELSITNSIITKRGMSIEMNIVADTNTWSNQRRKRRLNKRIEEQKKKIKTIGYSQHLNGNIESTPKNIIHGINHNNDRTNNNNDRTNHNNDGIKHINDETNHNNDGINHNNDVIKLNNDRTNHKNDGIKHNNDGTDDNNGTKHNNYGIKHNDLTNHNNVVEQPSKNAKDNVNTNTISERTQPLVHAISKLCKINDDIVLNLEYLSGTGGKESSHQILQYIKNNWKYFCFFFTLP